MFTARGDLADQPTADPTRKVAWSGIAGLLAVLALTILGAFGVEVPGVDLDALPVTEAFTGLVMWATSYLVRERA